MEELRKRPEGISENANKSEDHLIIDNIDINDVLKNEGDVLAIDLLKKKAYIYKNKELKDSYEMLSIGKPGSYWETPAGLYKAILKKRNHYSTIGKVYMPYSIQFFGNYFLHGWPYYPSGKSVPHGYSGGCMRFSTHDSKEIFNFVKKDTPIFVYESKEEKKLLALLA